METFCWFVLLKKVFVDEICLEVVWASLKNLCELTGSPYSSISFNRKSVKNKFVQGESRKTISSTKNPKIAIIEKETQQIHFYWKENDVNRFYLKKPCEKFIEKKQWSQFKVLRNPRKQVIRHGNSMKKNVIWKSIEFSFVIENPKKNFHSREIHQSELRSHENHGNWFLPRKSQNNQLQLREFRENSF